MPEVAHALMRAASPLSTNLGTNRWKQRTARSRGLWRQRRSRRDRLLLLSTPLDTGKLRCRHEQETVPAGNVSCSCEHSNYFAIQRRRLRKGRRRKLKLAPPPMASNSADEP